MAEPFANRALMEHLRSGASHRELIASRIRFFLALGGVVLTGIGTLVGEVVGLELVALLLVVVVLELLMSRALKRGWYRDWVPWLATAIEVSIPACVALVFAVKMGAILFLASGVTMLWACLISTTTLRVNPTLSVMAGVAGALEQAAISVFLIEPPLVSIAPALMHLPQVWLLKNPYVPYIGTAGRSLFLLMAGVFSGSVAALLMKQARDALRAVREQDLMGKYFLHERLGSGGMAEVFRATYSPEGGFEKNVALKRVLPELSANPEFMKMFLAEARLCSLLAHPNIVQVFDVGRFQSTYILAMELVDGLPLHKLLRVSGPLPVHAATFIAGELCAALDYLHGRIGADGRPLGLVHCDLNPPNVLVSRFGEVKLGDFGVARAANRAGDRPPSEIAGKVPYMAPEQLRGEPQDGRVDVFAVGLTLYELLCGERAFAGSDTEVLARVMQGKVPPISSRRAGLPHALIAVLERALAPAVVERPTAAELRAMLVALPSSCAPLSLGPGELTRLLAQALVPQTPGEALPLTTTAPRLEAVTEPAGSGDRGTRPMRREPNARE